MDDYSLLTISLSLLLSWLLYFLTVKILRWRVLPPGPWGLPVVGYLPWLDPEHPYLSFTNLARNFGPIYSIQMGRLSTIVITDPKLIKQAFNMDALTGRADLYLTHGIMKGYGLICSEGPRWREQRKFAATCLKNQGMAKSHPKREKMEALIVSGVNDTMMRITNDESSATSGVEFSHFLIHSIGNVMNVIIFGREYSYDDPTWKLLTHLAEEGVKLIGVAGPLNFLPFLRVIPKFRGSMDFIVNGLERTHEIYREITAEHTGEEDDVVGSFLREQRSRDDAKVAHSFSDDQLNFLAADLFGAGLDTTLATLRWFFTMMAVYPDKQEKVYTELSTVLGQSTKPCLEDSHRLPYLEAAVSESQRLRTVVPTGIPHGVNTDCQLGAYRLAKGTMVVPLLWAVHMDPQIWPQPDEYRPERFLDEDGNYRKLDALMPFQIGKRVCLGEELARMIIFLYASTILQKFKIVLPDDAIPEGKDPLEGLCGITFLPKYGRLIFKSRVN
ncbi:cytochrome P450 306a1 [Nilaparvata lugens]|uniref:cytochrome P450 306a1 n=1 Tax=Nilaparvata lugens TaxID=108931 RepID=UPI00193D08B6|nr:cytochrome P450 306a1 [Nilaparvata lugens]XP_039293149.1 cytochrome P450 306a1 [Nilaparvata lugens]XP_039293150.1 cytochrome P450 306a1 [Nilaparvata lugens]XP_039293151.1 cytochrome P450 306a1 [Nilaparvata lugens]